MIQFLHLENEHDHDKHRTTNARPYKVFNKLLGPRSGEISGALTLD